VFRLIAGKQAYTPHPASRGLVCRLGPGGRNPIVKPNIHPEYLETTVHCACGASWQTRSTSKDLHLDICSNCHPFFTGRQKLIDTEGRVDRFTKKFGAQTVEQRKAAAKAVKDAKKAPAKKKVS
jgi:large subunit ribosomal protein L31